MTSTQTTRKINHYFGTLVALAMIAAILALSALSAHASGKQGVSGANKKDAALTTTSSTSTPKASFASGSGANFLGVKVSDHGNLMSFESPQGQEATFDGQEGYALCSNSSATVHGHDTGSAEAGFGTPTFSQFNGTGTFPLTVTRKTTDGKLKLVQVWNKPDAVEKDVTLTMTVTNISGAQINGVVLSRSGDFDVGSGSADQGARTADSAWQWDDSSSGNAPAVGTMLTALTVGTGHQTLIERRPEWTDFTRPGCVPGGGLATPTSVQDLAMRVFYQLGDLAASQSKTVKFEYERM